MIKAYVNCVKNDILQFHIFKIAEETDFKTATYEFDVMGLYKTWDYNNKLRPEPNDEGISFKTASKILFGLKYDSVKTKALNLAIVGADGGAFKDENGVYTYVLWAKTTVDKSEISNATYSFPTSFNAQNFVKRNWDYSISFNQNTITGQNLALTATPIFLTESKNIKLSDQFICEGNSVNFEDLTPSVSRAWSIQIAPNSTVSETSKTFSKTFNQAGNYTVSLVSKDANGSEIGKQTMTISVKKTPTVDFTLENQSPMVRLKSLANANADSIIWTFSDGTSVSNQPNYTKVFAQTGTFNITLTAKNRCGSPNLTKSVSIIAPSLITGKTANDVVPVYDGNFRAGVNMRYTEGWTDEQIADIAAGNLSNNTEGIGAKSLRTALPEYFTKFWGADIRLKTMQHFGNLDLKDIVLTLGYPDSTHRDQGFYCYREQSYLFKNMYTDIWKNGVVNDSNYFARYVSDLVKTSF